MYWAQTHICIVANLPQKCAIFPAWSFRFLQTICRLCKHCCMYNPTGGIWCRHIRPRTHTTPITSLPRQRAVGAGQRRQSIDRAWRRRRRRRKEPQAMSSRGGEDLLEISAPWAFLPHMGKTRGQTAATALCCWASSHTERENVNCAASTLSAVQFCLLLIDFN